MGTIQYALKFLLDAAVFAWINTYSKLTFVTMLLHKKNQRNKNIKVTHIILFEYKYKENTFT